MRPVIDAAFGIEVARSGRRWRRALPFAAGAIAMLVVVLASAALGPDATSLTRSDVDEAVASALASLETEPATSERVYQIVAASIVFIETIATPTSENADDGDDGEGTGVVVNDNGDVLTALHVVAGAASIRLTFADGSRRVGTVASADSETDIALVTPDTPPDTVAAAILGNPRSVRVGSEAYIVANPLGLYRSLSAGVVSALDRAFRDPDTGTVRDGLIQFDAAVNPGSSGGPLLDRDGRVVGIVTALVNPTDQEVFIGVGLAVPIDAAGGGPGGFPDY